MINTHIFLLKISDFKVIFPYLSDEVNFDFLKIMVSAPLKTGLFWLNILPYLLQCS